MTSYAEELARERNPDNWGGGGDDDDSGGGGGGSSDDDSGGSSSGARTTAPDPSDPPDPDPEDVTLDPDPVDADPAPPPDQQQSEGADDPGAGGGGGSSGGGGSGSSSGGSSGGGGGGSSSGGSSDSDPSDAGSEFGPPVDVSPEEGDTTTEDGAQPTQPGMGADTGQQSEGAEAPEATPNDPAPDSPAEFAGPNETGEMGEFGPGTTGDANTPPEQADTTTPGGAQPVAGTGGTGERTTADRPAEEGNETPAQTAAEAEFAEEVARMRSGGPGEDLEASDVMADSERAEDGIKLTASVENDVLAGQFAAAPGAASVDNPTIRETDLFQGSPGAASVDIDPTQTFQASPMAAGPTAQEIVEGRRQVREAELADGTVQEGGRGELPSSPAAARAAALEAATDRAMPTGGSILGPPGDIEQGLYDVTADIAEAGQEEVVNPASDVIGDIFGARTEAEAFRAGVGDAETVETAGGDVLRPPDDEEGDPGAVEAGTGTFAEGAGDITVSAVQAPEAIRNVGVLGFDASKFAGENPEAAAPAAAGFAASRLSQAYEYAAENPVRTAGQLGGSVLVMGGAAAASSRAGLATRAAIQPGEEALGYGGSAAFRGAASAAETAGDVVPGRAGSAVAGTGSGLRRAGQTLFPNNEPLLISEEAGLAAIGRVGEGARRTVGGTRDVVTGETRLTDVAPTQAGELAGRFRPGGATGVSGETGPPGGVSEPLGGAGSATRGVESRSAEPVEVEDDTPGTDFPVETETQRRLSVTPRAGAGLVPPRVEVETETRQRPAERAREAQEPEVDPDIRQDALTQYQDFLRPYAEQELEARREQVDPLRGPVETERERAQEAQRPFTERSETEAERGRAGADVRADIRADVLQDQFTAPFVEPRASPFVAARGRTALGVDLDQEVELEQEVEREAEQELEAEQEVESEREREGEPFAELEPEPEPEVEVEPEPEQEVEAELFPEDDRDGDGEFLFAAPASGEIITDFADPLSGEIRQTDDDLPF